MSDVGNDPKHWRCAYYHARMVYPERYHRALPDEIRTYLKCRGIPATITERHLLGWNGERITIPVFNGKREVLGFRYAKSPFDTSNAPEMRSELGLDVELYGWDTLVHEPHRVVICGIEFDRLVLEAHGFAAVSSTGGMQTFPEAWLPYLEPVKHVYVCFSRDVIGAAAARKIQRLLPRVRIVTLPPEVGAGGTVSDFFNGLGSTRVDFELLLAGATAAADDDTDQPPRIKPLRPVHESVRRRAEGLKRAIRLHEIVSEYVDLRASGARLVGHCPFHDDSAESFSVYPVTDAYRCTVCGAEGDVVRFMMDKRSITLGQALEALEHFRYTHDVNRYS